MAMKQAQNLKSTMADRGAILGSGEDRLLLGLPSLSTILAVHGTTTTHGEGLVRCNDAEAVHRG